MTDSPLTLNGGLLYVPAIRIILETLGYNKRILRWILLSKLLQWVSGLRNKDIGDNATLSEVMKYRGVSFWWFIRFRIYRNLAIAFGKGQYHRSLTRAIFSKFNFLFFFYTIFVAFISKCIFPKRKKLRPNTIFVSYSFGGWRFFRDRLTGKLVWGHSLLSPVLDALSATSKCPEIISSYPIALNFPSLFKPAFQLSRNSKLGLFVPLESYFSWASFVQILRARRHFSKVWTKLKQNQGLVLDLDGWNILELFNTDFKYFFKFFLPLMVQYMELSIQLLKREQPDIILMKNEYSEYERALQFAAHFKKTPIVALQHGIINQNHPGYYYARNMVSQKGSAQFPYAPIPTKTAVFGPYYKKILTKRCSYPIERVDVTGSPRNDVLHFADQIYNKQMFCDCFGLDPNKKIVLIATQPLHVEKNRVDFLYNLIEALREVPDTQIVIKPHPNESSSWHKKHLKEWEVFAVILPPKSETNAAIHACDLFIAVHSTTIIEALLLGKLVIVVNFSKSPDILPWVQEGAVLGVYDPQELAPVIKKALFNEEAIRQELANRSKFVYNHTYKNDGKATERVIGVIKKYLRPISS